MELHDQLAERIICSVTLSTPRMGRKLDHREPAGNLTRSSSLAFGTPPTAGQYRRRLANAPTAGATSAA